MQFFNEVTPKQVLGILLDASKVERGMKKVEEREQFFGRIFGILAIFRSTRLLKEESDESKEVAKKCTEEVFALYKSKRWLREICVQTFLTMLRNAHVTIISTILEGTLPMFEETVVGENGEELLTPVPLTSSSLCYLLEVKTLLQQRELHLPEELQGIYESNPDIEPSHLSSLMGLYRESTFTFPKVHPLWQATIAYLRSLPSANSLLMAWWQTVTEHVMNTTERRRWVSSPSLSRSTCLKVCRLLFAQTPSSQLGELLNARVMAVIKSNSGGSKNYMQEQVVHLLDFFVTVALLARADA